MGKTGISAIQVYGRLQFSCQDFGMDDPVCLSTPRSFLVSKILYFNIFKTNLKFEIIIKIIDIITMLVCYNYVEIQIEVTLLNFDNINKLYAITISTKKGTLLSYELHINIYTQLKLYY